MSFHFCNMVHWVGGPAFCSDSECPKKRSMRYVSMSDVARSVIEPGDLAFEVKLWLPEDRDSPC